MDFRCSRKEKRWQPDGTGAQMVLVDQVFDVYPILDGNVIMDVECLFDTKAELLDRAMFAVVKQRGLDPVEKESGIQWAEAILGEIPAPLVITQVIQAVQEEGPAVRVEPYIDTRGLSFEVYLSNTK